MIQSVPGAPTTIDLTQNQDVTMNSVQAHERNAVHPGGSLPPQLVQVFSSTPSAKETHPAHAPTTNAERYDAQTYCHTLAERDYLQVCHDAAVLYIAEGLSLPIERVVRFPQRSTATPQEVKEKGEFWAARQGLTTPQELRLDWCVLSQCTAEQRAHLVHRTESLMAWIETQLTEKTFGHSPARKRKGCGIFVEFLELFFSVGSQCDCLALDALSCFKEAPAVSVSVAPSSYQDLSSAEAHGEEPPSSIGDVQALFPASDDAQRFTNQLTKTALALVTFGSPKEAYASLIGVLHHDDVGLYGKLLTLPLFATVLKSLKSKQAAFIMSVNTAIHTALFKRSPIVRRAYRNFEKNATGLHNNTQTKLVSFKENNRSLLPESTTIAASITPCTACEKPLQHIADAPPFYLQWLVATALYIVKYFDALEALSSTQHAEDHHSVGPNSCASLLSKAIVVLSLSFRIRLEPSESPKAFSTLEWSPFGDTVSHTCTHTTSLFSHWTRISAPAAFYCLIHIVQLYFHIMGEKGLSHLENVNVVTPLDDGGGDLEIAPLATAVVAAVSCIQQTFPIQINKNAASTTTKVNQTKTSVTFIHLEISHLAPLCLDKKHKQSAVILLPRVLLPWRYVNIAFVNTFVLLRCAIATVTDRGAQGSFVIFENPNSVTLSFRKQRASDLGLHLFSWACQIPHGLPSVDSEIFNTPFSCIVRPTQLLDVILANISQRPSELCKGFRLLLFKCLAYWTQRYPLSLRLDLLTAAISDNLFGTGSGSRAPLLTALVELFKQGFFDVKTPKCSDKDTDSNSTVQFCAMHRIWRLLLSDDIIAGNILHITDVWLTLLNLVKRIFLQPWGPLQKKLLYGCSSAITHREDAQWTLPVSLAKLESCILGEESRLKKLSSGIPLNINPTTQRVNDITPQVLTPESDITQLQLVQFVLNDVQQLIKNCLLSTAVESA